MVGLLSKKVKLNIKFGGNYDSFAIEKCTAALCISKGLMVITNKIPKNVLLLYPFAEKELSKKDSSLAKKGLYLIDAPWEFLPKIVSSLDKSVECRRLADVKETHGLYIHSDYKINTAGAAAIALFRLGFKKQAKELIFAFPWKKGFMKKNFKSEEIKK